MKEATIRPRNYHTFHTVCSSNSYQGKGKETDTTDSSTNWKSEWIKGSKTNNLPMAVQESEKERRLRSENDMLKARLNAATKAIRDMERAQKRQDQQPIHELEKNMNKVKNNRSSSNFRSFLDAMINRKQSSMGVVQHDDQSSISAACASQASTVQMGSSAKNRSANNRLHSQLYKIPKQQRNRSNNTRSKGNGEKHTNTKAKGIFSLSCSKSLMCGSKLRKKILQKESLAEQMKRDNMGQIEIIVTPPCTPERKHRDANIETTSPPTEAADILRDISSNINILGIQKYNKLDRSLGHLSTTAHSTDRSKNNIKNTHNSSFVQYKYTGSYPIDLYQATPICDDYSDSEEEDYLSTIHENVAANGGEYTSDEEDRVEI